LTSGVSAVAAGQGHSLAIRNGLVYAWGDNAYGQLGDGTTTDRTRPVQISGLSNITGMAAGMTSSYALAADGSLWVWGYNALGELGLGDTTDRLTPTHLLPPSGYRYAGIDADAFGDFAIASMVAVPEPATVALIAFAPLLLRRTRSTRRLQHNLQIDAKSHNSVAKVICLDKTPQLTSQH